MEILTYLQIREHLGEGYSEQQIEMILTVSGRASEWLASIATLVEEHDKWGEIELVERSGMGKAVMQQVPREEWVYLVNPSMAPEDSYVCKMNIVCEQQIWSTAFAKWLLAQESGASSQLVKTALTPEEARMMRKMWLKQETVVEREEMAEMLWGETWANNYSDWGIDALVYRLRKKLSPLWQIVTIKGRGYMLARTETSRVQLPKSLAQERIAEIPLSIYPSAEYLSYMNDPSRVRKVYADLLLAVDSEKITIPKLDGKRILCVNSYSYDNVDAIVAWVRSSKIKDVKVYFAHYDPNAIALHKARIEELSVSGWVEVVYDDLRESRLLSNSMELVINDFRLNFNQNDAQNQAMMRHTRRVLSKSGVAWISTVVDGRYEQSRYGVDQENAPINKYNPGVFQADENLVRRCWSVPYYRQLYKKTGFSQVREFDIEKGKRWGETFTNVKNPRQGPYYRRWALV